MTQNATVTKLLDGRMAEVLVTRLTACGGSCSGSCETCMMSGEMKVNAYNRVHARPGQKVVIESQSGPVYKAILLVYLLPVLLMIAGYAVGAAAGLTEKLCVLCCFGGLLLGAALIVLINKIKSPVSGLSYTICRIVEEV